MTHNLPITIVTSPGGITAWLVEDRMVPVISLQFAFRGGSALDPADKAGLANLVASTLDEGAGNLPSLEFHRALEDQSIYLSFSAKRDDFHGGVKTLRDNAGEAWRLLTLALTQPRFDDEEVARVKEQLISDIQHHYADPSWVAQRTLNKMVYAGHPYQQPTSGFEETVARLTADDLRVWVSERMARDNLVVGVCGDISATDLAPLLDQIFGTLPVQSKTFELSQVTLAATGKNFTVTRGIPQTRVVMAQPGIPRTDPDWFAAMVMNYVLGGGGFNSRLMMEVREKRGLTYGVSSQLSHNKYANIMTVGAATSNENAAEAIRIIKSEWQTMANDGVSAEELKNAQTYLTGSLPLALTSTDKIADFILHLQVEHLGIDYPARRLERLGAVTRADVARAAKRLLNPEALTLVAVGQPQNLMDSIAAPDPAQGSHHA